MRHCSSLSRAKCATPDVVLCTIAPPSDDPMAAVGRQVIAKVDPRKPPSKGQRIELKVRPGEALLFSPSTGLRLAS